jgi:hypothetical protein
VSLKPLIVYLDSSDYSVLSDPTRRTPTLDRVCIELREFAKTTEVKFAYSGAHLCEMAPLNEKSTHAAAARADLLVDLCGRNAFISFDRLIKAELIFFLMPMGYQSMPYLPTPIGFQRSKTSSHLFNGPTWPVKLTKRGKRVV